MISYRSFAVCACLCLVLSACGLESRPGAVGPQQPTSSSPSEDIAQPMSPENGYQRVELGKEISGFVPTDSRWTVLTEPRPSGQVVRILDTSARVSILLQETRTSETAEQLCGRAIGGLVAGTGITPSPHTTGISTPSGVHAFSCSANGLPDNGNDAEISPADSATPQSSATPGNSATPQSSATPGDSATPSAASSPGPSASQGPGTFDVLVDVAIRAADDVGYVQITRIDAAMTGQEREAVTVISQEIFAETTTNMR